jgi:hypothetical protein
MEGTSLTAAEIQAGLAQFGGSATFTLIHPNLRITEGVQWLCDHARCYWLMDCIFTYQTRPEVAQLPFQFIDLCVNLAKQTALIEVRNGDAEVILRQKIPQTDFPLVKLRLYYTQGVVLLPGEY